MQRHSLAPWSAATAASGAALGIGRMRSSAEAPLALVRGDSYVADAIVSCGVAQQAKAIVRVAA
jgi:hypothetical protein